MARTRKYDVLEEETDLDLRDIYLPVICFFLFCKLYYLLILFIYSYNLSFKTWMSFVLFSGIPGTTFKLIPCWFYSSPPLSEEYMFQDPKWMPEIACSAEHYIYYAFSYI